MFAKLISLFFMIYLAVSSDFNIPLKGYESKQLFADPGFEIHGNYDCTVEIRNFALTSYNKS